DLFQEQLNFSSFLSFKTINDSFLDSIFNLMKKIENGIKENPKYPKKTDVIEGYLALLGFTRIFEYYNDSYVSNVEKLADDDISITLQCLDASEFILDTVKNKTYGSVFFSATLYPIEYYKELITCGYGETLKIRSPFDSNRLKLVVMNQISTRYQ